MSTERRDVAVQQQQRTEWYTNRDLLEMLQGVREELAAVRAEQATLRSELRTTTEAVRRYNGLRERIDETERKLSAHLLTGAGQASAARGIREWSGWIVALLSLIATWVISTRG